MKSLELLTEVRTYVFDYDGTLAPMNVDRSASYIPQPLREVLEELAKVRKVVIATTKDCSFILPRTPFAHAWVCSNGFEIRVKGSSYVLVPTNLFEKQQNFVEEVVEPAKKLCNELGIFLEIKRVGNLVAGICIDWRGRYPSMPEEVRKFVDVIEGRYPVIRYVERPFVDIYIDRVDKGTALDQLLRLGLIERPIAYFGDSENDVPGYQRADVRIFVVHEDNEGLDLGIENLIRVKREELANVLRKVLSTS